MSVFITANIVGLIGDRPRIKRNIPYVLDWLDTGKITNMDSIFNQSSFNRNSLLSWDVSRVNSMKCMFSGSEFNHLLSNWNAGNVKNMQSMFRDSQYGCTKPKKINCT